MSEILKLTEVAEKLKINPRTLANLASEGKIPAFRVGRSWRLYKEELEIWIKKQHNQSPNFKKTSDKEVVE